MPRIVAVGGGSMAKGQTLSIDREIVSFAGRRNPRALFVPTASGEDPGYVEGFRRVYGTKLGCRVDVLYLLKNPPPPAELRERVERADLIYVGGGNTLRMMRRWRHLGLDLLLKRAARRRAVLAGSSAGAICWFAWGHSDSWFYYKNCPRKYIRVRGLGLVNLTFCPHYHGERRERDFSRMMVRFGGPGIAVNERCALQIRGRRWRLLTAGPRTGAYRMERRGGKAFREKLPATPGFLPLEALGA